jgi:prephenate dehydratase
LTGLLGLQDVHDSCCKSFKPRNPVAQNPQLQQIIGADTAGSICRIVSEGISTNAAIGSRRAAEIYGAKVLRKDIADDIDNWTTFCLIGK